MTILISLKTIIIFTAGYYTAKLITSLWCYKIKREIWLKEFYNRRRVLIFNKEQENEN